MVRVMVVDPVTVIVMTLVVTVMVMMMVTMLSMMMVIDSVMNLVTAVMVMDLMGWKTCFWMRILSRMTCLHHYTQELPLQYVLPTAPS